VADFKKLLVWQRAHELSLVTAKALETVKGTNASIIRGQLTRSILSIQANLAEGSAKRSDREFARFVRIALGSSTESENHLVLLRDLRLIDEQTFEALRLRLSEVGRMLTGLERRLDSDASARRPALPKADSR
jgi:four helix bundle protein